MKKAIVAVTASMLTAMDCMLRDGAEHNHLGVDHFDQRDEAKTVKRLKRWIREFEYDVQISKGCAREEEAERCSFQAASSMTSSAA